MRTPQIKMEAPVHDSSRVKLMGIDASSGTVVIQFPNDTKYHYKGAGQVAYEEVRTSESAGKAVRVVLDRFPYHKVEKDAEGNVKECDCFEIPDGQD